MVVTNGRSAVDRRNCEARPARSARFVLLASQCAANSRRFPIQNVRLRRYDSPNRGVGVGIQAASTSSDQGPDDITCSTTDTEDATTDGAPVAPNGPTNAFRYGNIAIVNQNTRGIGGGENNRDKLEFITSIAIEKEIDVYTFQELKAGGIEKEFDVHGYTLLCNQRLHVHRRRQLYQMYVLRVLLAGCETWAVKHSHLQALASFHNKCTRTMCGINLRHCQMHKISTKSILERLDILSIDKIFYIRQLRFLQRVASMEPSRLLFQTLSSQAARLPGMKMTAGRKTNTLSTWLHTLEQTGLATKGSGGKLKEWTPKIRSSICATLAEETLELPTGSIKFKARPMHPHKGF